MKKFLSEICEDKTRGFHIRVAGCLLLGNVHHRDKNPPTH